MADAVVFEDYGITIMRGDGGYRVLYDSGESAGSVLKERALTDDQARRAMVSETEAYRVVLEVDGL